VTVASLALTEEELRRLAEQLAPLLLAALPRDPAPAGWMDAKAAAAYAGCSLNAIHKAMAAREVEFRQDTKGGKAWFRAEWLDAWRGL
jgi:hypothetical protein